MVVLASRSRGDFYNGQHQFKPSVPAAISSPAASEEAMDSSYWSIHGQAIILTWKQLSL